MSAARAASTEPVEPVEPVRYARQGPVAVVTMDRPEYHRVHAGVQALEVLGLVDRALGQGQAHAGQFGPHHPAHAHNAETAPDALGGMDIRSMKAAGA
ncbi:hypothetical protein ACWGI1_16865 [Streptomyces sp. NPDC054835]|uniref:hypothetical protein n=1 Tax=Streptomyces sp. NBC_01268 TaxID=2903806 RepID=UPI003FCED091